VPSRLKFEAGLRPGDTAAVLRALDANLNDTHRFELASGAGDVNNGFFTIVENRLLVSDSYHVVPGDKLLVRIRAVDSGGLSVEEAFVFETTKSHPPIVINEIHYNPSDNTVNEEFIEL